MHLPVSSLHSLWYDCYGKPQGEPVLYLHGGPGGHIQESQKQFFDPERHFVVFFEQRGCGRSLPFAELQENTLDELIEDCERLRVHLKLDSWHLFGGSFGSTLALCYAIRYPERIRSLTLRGIFLGRQEDIIWLYQDGASDYFPDSFARFRDFIPQNEQDDLIQAYAKRLFADDNPELQKRACKHWSDWEGSVIRLLPQAPAPLVTDADIALAKLECHYFVNRLWWQDDNFILNHIDRIRHLPCTIIHGRYDMDCRPVGAWLLHQAWPQSNLHFVDAAGHSSAEEPIAAALTAAMARIG